MSARRKLLELEVTISENFQFNTQRQIKYLGLILDKDVRMATHVDHVTSHAEKKGATLIRANIGDLEETTRRIYAMVPRSVVMYAALLWLKVWKINAYKKN